MTEKTLAVNVTVGTTTFEAGTVPPKEIADQITNPKAWGDTPEPEGKAAPIKRAARKTVDK
ncbi:MAG: hypothetical protein JWO15_3842 [Sphingomonadales bacterium]|nr:hypothetical protein [Sphingomonadales bacterium]